jgi:CubicO group peptidase (beta-lactamase class C family)
MLTSKFEHITRLLQSYVDNGEVMGIGASILQAGEERYRQNFGFANKEKNAPIENDTIYRLFSMTKPVTATAMMILFERGLFDLYDPVSKYIPAYKNQKVMTAKGLVPVETDVTIKDLFNMTSGIPYPDVTTVSGLGMEKIFSQMAQDMENGKLWSTQEFIAAFASVPLAFQPGSHWLYGVSADIIGALIEVMSGKTLGQFMKEELFDPLGMVDTAFWVPEEKRKRFAQVYAFDQNNILVPFTKNFLCLNNYLTAPSFESGGAGLVSTIDDYAKFALMLLNNGTFKGKKILSKKSIELMSSNHLTTPQIKERTWESQRGYGYGMLMRTMLNPADAGCLGSVGEFGWDGWTGNWFFIDPQEKLIAFFMIQRAPGDSYHFVPRFKNALYSSL